MVSRSLVLGYHGCDALVAQGLIDGSKQPNFSENKNDWLGKGFYFWEDSPSRARIWALEQRKRFPEKVINPSVVGAVIDLGNCLNLIDAEHLELVSAAHRIYLDICAVSGATVAENKGDKLYSRKLDYAVFETLHQNRRDQGEPSFDTVRAFFVEGREIYPAAGLRILDHVQICIRNPDNILGFFRPRTRLIGTDSESL